MYGDAIDMGPDPSISPDVVVTPDPADRSLYDSDIGSGEKTKFAEVAVRHMLSGLNTVDDNYFLVRVGQYEYRLYIGDIDADGSINECDVYTLRGLTSGYQTQWSWSKVELSTGAVDLAGNAAYIYSSYEPYPALPGVASAKVDCVLTLSVFACMVLMCIVSLGSLIRGWFHARR